MERERRNWLHVLIRIRGSVLPEILPRSLLCGAFGALVSVLYDFGLPVSLPALSSLVPSIVLGLLLVFRTNTAYERFWEGRILWGTLINTVRNLARKIWVTVEECEPSDRLAKVATLRLLVAFAVAMKRHLRGESPDQELDRLMPTEFYEKLQEMNHPPLEVAFWIGDYLQHQYELGRANIYQVTAMFQLLDKMVDVLGGCERILKTPIPLAYSIHLKQLMVIYCLSLPFQLVSELHWWTGAAVALIGFTIFGIEAIGLEIENPFGGDPNDLPLDAICATMERNIEDLITLAPTTRHWRTQVLS